ncbi:MAG: DNA polymerase-3 subunit epsilon, partial [Patiriisocius sp.]
FCSLQNQGEACSHYKIKNCKGICEDLENVALYNGRVTKAIEAFQKEQPSYIIKGKGRTASEFSIILVEQGTYKGFGFIDGSEAIQYFDDFANHITLCNSTFHTTKIIQSYLKKNSKKDVITKKEATMAP